MKDIKSNSQQCSTVGVEKKEGGNTQNLHNQPRIFCESEQLGSRGNRDVKSILCESGEKVLCPDCKKLNEQGSKNG